MSLFKKAISPRWALFIPILVCLAAVFPGTGTLFLGFENRATDFLFYLSPSSNLSSSVVVVAKDQATIDFLGRDPNRGDMAKLLRKLASAGVQVVALDFIYDSPKSPPKDSELTAAFDLFPGLIVAERFRPREALSAGMEKIQINDENAARPPWPLPLYEPIAGAAKDRGLVNVFRDRDGVIRVLPLAFFPDEMPEFRPSLSFSAWIASLLAKTRPPKLSEFPIPDPVTSSFEASFTEWVKRQFQEAPRVFIGVGVKELDQIIRRRELRWFTRYLSQTASISLSLEKQTTLQRIAEKFDLESLPRRTWLDESAVLPPFFGASTTPCLRIPFSKVAFSEQGNAISDGIGVFSMKTLLEADDRTKDSLALSNEAKSDSFTGSTGPIFDFSNVGSNTLSGICLAWDGTPEKEIIAFCYQIDGGFWATGTSDTSGRYVFENLPSGNYSVELVKKKDHGTQRFKLENPVAVGEGLMELSIARFLPQDLTIHGKIAPALSDRRIILEADIIWVAKSGPNGELPLSEPPPGFTLTSIEGEEGIVWATSPSRLLSADGKPLCEKRIALLEDSPAWKETFFASCQVKKGTSEFDVSGLCPALGALMAIEETGTYSVKPRPYEVDICIGEKVNIASLTTVVSVGAAGEAFFPSRFIDQLPPEASVWLQTPELTWVHAPARELPKIKLRTGTYRVFATEPGKRGRFNWLASKLTGKIVFIGTHLLEDQDFFTTPINFLDGQLKPVPGVNVHARLCSALCENNFLRPTFLHVDWASWKWPVFTFLFLFPFLFGAEEIFRRQGALTGGIVIMLLGITWITGAIVMFRFQWLVPCAFPIISIGLFGSLRGYQAYADSRQLELQTRSTLKHFLSGQMVEDILKNPEILKPGGEKKILSVIFTDLANFTTLAEALPADDLVLLMNEYLNEMTHILFDNGGTLDKYIGDAIMGFWNYPVLQTDHAIRACTCAVTMQRRLKELQKRWAERGLPNISMRAGINSAECVVGFIGSDIQMNFTCMGDGVNLSSRLEGANKEYQTQMMISESTYIALENSNFRTRFLDFLSVKGKVKPVKVFELIGEKGEEDELWGLVLPKYSAGINFYLNQNWENAKSEFLEVLKIRPADGPSLTYLNRCNIYQETPPPKGWDGRFIMKTK